LILFSDQIELYIPKKRYTSSYHSWIDRVWT
jgi:hypothetical protein